MARLVELAERAHAEYLAAEARKPWWKRRTGWLYRLRERLAAWIFPEGVDDDARR